MNAALSILATVNADRSRFQPASTPRRSRPQATRGARFHRLILDASAAPIWRQAFQPRRANQRCAINNIDASARAHCLDSSSRHQAWQSIHARLRWLPWRRRRQDRPANISRPHAECPDLKWSDQSPANYFPQAKRSCPRVAPRPTQKVRRIRLQQSTHQ